MGAIEIAIFSGTGFKPEFITRVYYKSTLYISKNRKSAQEASPFS